MDAGYPRRRDDANKNMRRMRRRIAIRVLAGASRRTTTRIKPISAVKAFGFFVAPLCQIV